MRRHVFALTLLLCACHSRSRDEAYDSHVSMALVLLREGQTQAALEQLARSESARDTTATPRWLAETVSTLLGRRELAIADSLLRRYPERGADLQLQRANLLEMRGQLREADALYDRLDEDPEYGTTARVKRATIALLEGRAQDARLHAQAIVDQDAYHHRARTMLAQAHLAEGNPEAAYQEIVRTPDGPTRHLVEGESLLRAGRAQEALAPLNELVKLQRDAPRPRLLLGEALLELGELDLARPLLEQLAAGEQPFENAQMLLARLERERGHDARADSLDLAYRRVRRWREAMALRNEGLQQSREGRLEEALGYFERAREMLPEESEFSNDIGAIYARLQRYEEAEAAFLAVVELNPRNAAAHRNLANLYNILGDEDARDTHMQTYLRLVVEENRGER